MTGGTISRSIEDVGCRIDRNAVQSHLIVQMGAGTAPGISMSATTSPLRTRSSSLFQPLIDMGITGHDAVTVVDDDNLAQRAFVAHKGDDAISSSDDRGTFTIGDIDSFVELPPPGERGYTVIESGGNPSLCRSDGRCVRQHILLLLQLAQEQRQRTLLFCGGIGEHFDLPVHILDEPVLCLIYLHLGSRSSGVEPPTPNSPSVSPG